MAERREGQGPRTVAVPIDIREWMWSPDGLALRCGCELLVYAAIYGAAEAGLVFSATCGRLADRIGFPRETVQRALQRLLEADLVWSPCRSARGGAGGRPPRVYACYAGPMRRAQGAVGTADPYIEVPVPPCAAACSRAAGSDPTAATAVEGKRSSADPDAQAHAETDSREDAGTTSRDLGPSFQQSAHEGDGTESAAREDVRTTSQNPGGSFQQSSLVGDGTEGFCDGRSRKFCDGTSRNECDVPCNIHRRHIGKCAPPPAETRVFDIPHIPTCPISKDMKDMKGNVRLGEAPADEDATPIGTEATDSTGVTPVPDATDLTGGTLPDDNSQDSFRAHAPSALTEADRAAFDELLKRSLLPVDPSFVGRNLEAFSRLVASGIPADAILTAYDEYARYQREQRRKTGEMRPMHLLRWLTQEPNNIRFVLRRRDEALARQSARSERWGLGRKGRPSHEDPLFTRCRDTRGRLEWHVNDDRGARRVRGAEGVESETRVRAIYERMYELEEVERAQFEELWRRRNERHGRRAGTLTSSPPLPAQGISATSPP